MPNVSAYAFKLVLSGPSPTIRRRVSGNLPAISENASSAKNIFFSRDRRETIKNVNPSFSELEVSALYLILVAIGRTVIRSSDMPLFFIIEVLIRSLTTRTQHTRRNICFAIHTRILFLIDSEEKYGLKKSE